MPTLHRLLWVSLVVLIAIGVTVSAARSLSPNYVTKHVLEVRERALTDMGIVDLIAESRRAEVEAFERKFNEYRVAALLHVIPGALFLALGALQLVRRIRSWKIDFHRWNGRILLVLALASIIPGLFFGIVMPSGGLLETAIIAFFGGLFVISLGKGFVAIRAKRVSEHREWMLRAYAVAIGISMTRVLGPLVDATFTATGLSTSTIFAIDLAAGFGVTSLMAEYWIRRTRPRTQTALAPVVA